MKMFSLDSQSCRPGFNRDLPRYEAGVLTTTQRHDLRMAGFNFTTVVWVKASRLLFSVYRRLFPRKKGVLMVKVTSVYFVGQECESCNINFNNVVSNPSFHRETD
jgi:hypothetical protein